MASVTSGMNKSYLSLNNPILFAVLAGSISTFIFAFYIWLAQNGQHFEQLQPLLNGTASRPYVYRVLTPFAIRWLSQIGSVSIETGSLIFMYASLLAFTASFAYLSSQFLSPAGWRIITLLTPVGLIPFLLEQRHIYDLVTLFLFTISLGLLAHTKWNVYLLAFSLACLSKETSLFLILFFAIHFRGLPKRQYAMLLSTQAAIYVVLRLAIMWLFRNNPGSVMEFHFYDQVQTYPAHPWQTILFSLFIFSVLALLVYQWKNKPLFLRAAALSIGLPIAGLYIFFGMPYELRVFLEVYPILYLLACFPFPALKKQLQADYNQV